jgi:hypothetical protein
VKTHRLGVLSFVICSIILAACGPSGVYKDGEYEAYAAPGKTVNFNIVLAQCIQSHWASDDLKIFLKDPDGNVVYEQQFSQIKDWESSLDMDQEEKSAKLDFKVMVPENIPAGTLLSGMLVGKGKCPRKNGNVNGTFMAVDVEIQIHVMTEKSVKNVATNHFMDGFFQLLGLVAIIAVIYFVGKIAGKNKARYRISRF